jgi:putative nucleotidyltransferase with HDIG domain
MADKKEHENDDVIFSEIPLAKIEPDVDLPCDIYLKISQKKLKYLYKGDQLDADKFDYFVSKNVPSIFIDNSELKSFTAWLENKKKETVDELTKKVGEENRALAEKREEMRERIYETFTDQKLDATKVEILQNEVKSIVNSVSSNPKLRETLAYLLKHDRSMVNHSINVANISVYLAMALGYSHHDLLENIYLGAIFHDYGKAKIPSFLLENKNSVAYKQAMNKHPSDGAKIAASSDKLHNQALSIVLQHHEQWDGKGYPKALKGDDIYKPAQIVAMANIFDNIVEENKKKPKEMYKKAIKVIEYDKGKMFNPSLTERVVEALNLVYANKEE